MRSCRISSLFFIFTCGILAGCVAPEASNEHEIVAFAAEYLTEEKYRHKITLGEPQLILGRNGEWVEALPLRRESLDDARHVDVDWLDRELRLVRSDDLCDRAAPEGCETAAIEWGRETFPPYVPLHFAHADPNGPLVIHTPYERIELDVDVKHEGERRVHTVDLGHVPARLRDFIPASVHVRAGELAPLVVQVDSPLRGPYDKERISYEPGTALRLPDAMPTRTSTLTSSKGQGTYFAGEQGTLFGLNFSHVQLIDGMTNSEPEIAAAADAGCLRSYVLAPAPPASVVPLPSDQVLGQKRVAFVRLAYAQKDAAPVEWEAEIYETLDGPRFEVKGSQELPVAPGCPPPRRHWPALDADEFVDKARALIDERHPMASFHYTVNPPYWLPGLAENQSWQFYQALFRPDWAAGLSVGYKPLRVTVDADTGLVVDLIVEASDYGRVDRRAP